MASLVARIERLSIPEPNSGCWLWLGSLSHLGYGRILLNGKVRGAHRASWLAYRGDFGDLHVLHRCDNRACVNPDHLFLGTRTDNMLDMHAKNRHPKVRLPGELHPQAIITEEIVRIIRDTPKHTRGLAARLGISHKIVHQVRSRATWKHI